MKRLSICIGISLLAFLLFFSYFSFSKSLLLAIVLLLITLWSSEALALGVVSLLPIALFPIAGILPIKEVGQFYTKPVIFLFMGGFLLAMAVEKTKLHTVIAYRLLTIFPHSKLGIIYAISIVSASLSALLSNVTVTLLLTPIALYLTTENSLRKSLLLAVAYGASIGGILTPIGTAPNLILLGFAEEKGIETISFLEWFLMTLPLAVCMLAVLAPIVSFACKKNTELGERTKIQRMNAQQKKLACILLLLAVILLINSPIRPFYSGLGIDEKLLFFCFGIVMFIPPFSYLEWKDMKNFPFDILFLFGAGFAIAGAIISSGMAQEIVLILSGLNALPLFFLLLGLALFVSLCTEITSNTAMTSMLIPIVYLFTETHVLPTFLVMMVAAISASYAFILPIATPPNAIAMSSGILKIKDMLKKGIWLNLLGVVLIAIIAKYYWSLFLF